MLNVRGDLTADVTVTGAGVPARAPALTNLIVTGAVTGSDLSVAGNVAAVTVGAFRDSRLSVNYDPATSTFGSAATVNSFRVTGATNGFQDSDVFAPTLRTVVLKSLGPTDGEEFGFTADVLGSLRVLTGSLFTYDPAGPPEQREGQFVVRVV